MNPHQFAAHDRVWYQDPDTDLSERATVVEVGLANDDSPAYLITFDDRPSTAGGIVVTGATLTPRDAGD